MSEGVAKDSTIFFKTLEGEQQSTLRLSEKYWGVRGWTSSTMNGMYAGCPELPDGSK